MKCYRVHVPDGVRIHGVTAEGRPATIHPGEYLVHRLRPKVAPNDQALLRFVGADVAGHDVHVPAASLRRLAVSCGVPDELLADDGKLSAAA
jgi:hypothetical protein